MSSVLCVLFLFLMKMTQPVQLLKHRTDNVLITLEQIPTNAILTEEFASKAHTHDDRYATHSEVADNVEPITRLLNSMKVVFGIDCSERYYKSTETSIDVDVDMSKVYKAYNMFYNCSKLTTLTNHDTWNLNFLEDASGMFNGCSKIASLNVRSWGLGNLTKAYNMFRDCKMLETLDGTYWWKPHLLSASYMFASCSKLQSLSLEGFDMSHVSDCQSMFSGCGSLSNLSQISNWNMSSVQIMTEMFNRCGALTSLDLKNWDLRSCSNMTTLFFGCSSLFQLRLDNWKLSEAVNCRDMFRGCSSLEAITINGAAIKILANNSNGVMSINDVNLLQDDVVYDCQGSVNDNGVFEISSAEQHQEGLV